MRRLRIVPDPCYPQTSATWYRARVTLGTTTICALITSFDTVRGYAKLRRQLESHAARIAAARRKRRR